MAYTGTPAVTSNYAGQAAGFYISAALNEAKSLEGLTMLENIKFKENTVSFFYNIVFALLANKAKV